SRRLSSGATSSCGVCRGGAAFFGGVRVVLVSGPVIITGAAILNSLPNDSGLQGQEKAPGLAKVMILHRKIYFCSFNLITTSNIPDKKIIFSSVEFTRETK